MKNFIVIKSQDRGGSYFIKNNLLPRLQVKGRANFIYDINDEYHFENEVEKEFGNLPDMEDFLNFIPCEKKSYANIVFEEATGFFSRSGGSSKLLLQHITRRHHTKNVNVFIFHDLLKIPDDIMTYVDFLILFRVASDPIKVYKKFESYPKIIEAFNDVQSKTENTFFDRENLIYPDERSKKFFHYKRIIKKD